MKDTHKDEFDLKGHERSHKANLAKLFQPIHLSTDFAWIYHFQIL